MSFLSRLFARFVLAALSVLFYFFIFGATLKYYTVRKYRQKQKENAVERFFQKKKEEKNEENPKVQANC